MVDLPLTGGCLCGSVRYEIDEPLVSSGYCHCTRCQRRTGTAAAPSARIAPGSLRIVAGEELVRCWQPDEGFEKCFCSNCGGQLFSRHPDGTIWSVRMGTLDEDPGMKPKHRQYLAYAASWEPVPDDDIPHYDEKAP